MVALRTPADDQRLGWIGPRFSGISPPVQLADTRKVDKSKVQVVEGVGLRIGLAAAAVLGILVVVDWFAIFAIATNCSGTDASEPSDSALCSGDIDTLQAVLVLVSLVPLAISCFQPRRRRTWRSFLRAVIVGVGGFALLGIRLRVVRGGHSSGIVDPFFVGLPLFLVALAVLALFLVRVGGDDSRRGRPAKVPENG